MATCHRVAWKLPKAAYDVAHHPVYVVECVVQPRHAACAHACPLCKPPSWGLGVAAAPRKPFRSRQVVAHDVCRGAPGHVAGVPACHSECHSRLAAVLSSRSEAIKVTHDVRRRPARGRVAGVHAHRVGRRHDLHHVLQDKKAQQRREVQLAKQRRQDAAVDLQVRLCDLRTVRGGRKDAGGGGVLRVRRGAEVDGVQ
eukprot:356534-Chlamydomonas_euryale.AAC.13